MPSQERTGTLLSACFDYRIQFYGEPRIEVSGFFIWSKSRIVVIAVKNSITEHAFLTADFARLESIERTAAFIAGVDDLVRECLSRRSIMLGGIGKCCGRDLQLGRESQSGRRKKKKAVEDVTSHYWSGQENDSRRRPGLETESTVTVRITAFTPLRVLLPSSSGEDRLEDSRESQGFHPYMPGQFVPGGGWNHWLRVINVSSRQRRSYFVFEKTVGD
ncbi:hypothetical protein CPC08DRAFT_725002 [Agrocybe pediades]|nr:hypothetical protein CPC08DRAFT_725002 [Agrocybe pediades]